MYVSHIRIMGMVHCDQKRFSLSSVSVSLKFFTCEILPVCRLKYPYSCFSSYFFSGYFCSVDACVVCIVSWHCYQFFSVLFNDFLPVVVSMH